MSVPAVSGTVVVADLGAEPETSWFNVGLYDVPPDLEAGDAYDGATVRSVNRAIAFISVETADPAAFEALARLDDNVRYLNADRPDAVKTTLTPNDPSYGSQYGWVNTNTPVAWDTTLGSTAVTVAVLDTGIQASHPDFTPARVLTGITFAGGNQRADGNGHGTHVSGTVGATTNNGIGVAGASQSIIVPVKVLDDSGSGSFAGVANGITWAADAGAHVLSLSLGCAAPCFDQATTDAINYAHNTRGALVVIAAGNDYGAVGFPGTVPNAFTVACTTSSNSRCSFSNFGPEVDISAPGSSILSTYIGGTYASLSGTSMSTPHVSGIAALVKTANPSFTNVDIANRITSTAIAISGSGMGAGLIDAGAAVGAAPPPPPPPPPPPGNQAPTASFTFACTELACSFDGSASSDPDLDPLTYAWDFGDGVVGTGVTASHTYGTAGTYVVVLTVTDPGALTGSASQAVTVSTAPPPPPPPPPPCEDGECEN